MEPPSRPQQRNNQEENAGQKKNVFRKIPLIADADDQTRENSLIGEPHEVSTLPPCAIKNGGGKQGKR
jgi:hypothetical protein